ncbi:MULTISPECIES: sulfite exporter TauE/SafE family protein [Candidatus Ichthyocystis]|uniref:Probable membrane transporter protein n=1 Tax=Candidatus Ichthyocystis hellenicum TaxID=1561003 RepID=A0A0S4M2Y7_9BURK|nr:MULTISPECIES: sulfite exporter TauE/SafE family protein [Ichthyocystis]CUT17234.1 putative membrane protein, TauE/SafE family [Candidatus Ichthyocystis hellenicum]
MNISLIWITSYIISGLLTGIISGITGLSGGIISVSVLTLIFELQHYPPEEGYRISLATAAFLTLMAAPLNAYFHLRQKNFYGPFIKKYLGPIAAGSIFGAAISHKLPITILKVIFILICVSALTKVLWKKKSQQETTSDPLDNKIFYILYGMSGFISSLVSIGGGSIYLPLLTSQRINIAKAVGTSSLLVLMTTIGTAIGHISISTDQHAFKLINTQLLIYMGIPTFVGTKIGSSIINKIPSKLIKATFSIVIILSLSKMIHSLL